MLRIANATVRYDGATRDALHDVSFHVEPGTVCCIIGPNGAGKSTLMSAIVGLTPLTAGAITLDDASVPDSMALRRRVGFAAQTEALYPLLSGRENLSAFGRLAGVERPVLERRIGELAERLTIERFLDRPVRELSGGERRRVHVAAALISEADVVMLDEPTAGVDPLTRSNVVSLVNDIAATGTSVLYSTHYLQEVEQLGGQVVMLERNDVVRWGTVSSLIARHGSSRIEMVFAEQIDTATLPWVSRWHGSTLHLVVQQPNEELPRILHHLGDDALLLRSLEVVEPTLEHVFMELTGHRFAGDDSMLTGDANAPR